MKNSKMYMKPVTRVISAQNEKAMLASSAGGQLGNLHFGPGQNPSGFQSNQGFVSDENTQTGFNSWEFL